ncbi:hypothetical protein ACQP1K_24015 [Sphaerimonospora sp. CA-214678]|uniref:hypothetical protein n=1 Tax=Sphaerimonospora sp. CA-214678 TaxID=3240029 RepID=UPI003D8A821C
MAPRIPLSVPASVSATLVVAAPERSLSVEETARLRDGLPDGVDLRLTEIDARDPALARTVSRLRCPHCSPEVDPLVGVLLERTDAHLAVTCAAASGWPPVHLRATAGAVDQIMELTGGVLLDTGRAALLPPDWRPRTSTSPQTFPVVDWAGVDVCLDDGGRYGLETTGMSRFGLPDLRVAGLQEHHIHGWLHLMYGLAGVLVRGVFKGAGVRRDGVHLVPVEISVSTTDTAIAMAVPLERPPTGPPRPPMARPAGPAASGTRRKIPGGRANVRLRHDVPACRLIVLPPADLSGSETRWRDRTAMAMCQGDDAR